MKIHPAFATVFALGLVAVGPSRVVAVEPQVTGEQIVPESRLARDVTVRNVEVDDETVSGTVVNNSDKVLRDVRLMIRRSWLWDDEFHPGTDDPSRTEYYVVHQDIPPGAQVPFTYRSDSPLREGRGGHFVTDVRVASVVQYDTAPTAGTTAAPPVPTTGGTRLPAERPREGY